MMLYIAKNDHHICEDTLLSFVILDDQITDKLLDIVGGMDG